MSPQENNPNPSVQTGEIACSQCGAPMPREMRFCRNCGNRLGEGPAEYTETVRLPNAAGRPASDPFAPAYAAPLVQQPYKKRRRFTGMTWLIIAIVTLFLMGGVL